MKIKFQNPTMIVTTFDSKRLDQSTHFKTSVGDLMAWSISINRKGYGIINGNAIILN